MFKENIEKIKTTTMGVDRIKRNLRLGNIDVVEYCKQEIIKSGDITRRGKNWYVTTDYAIITVNANSFTIITAHVK